MNILNKVVKKIQRYILDPIKYSKKLGVTIGNNCKLQGVPNWGSEPFLISLGNRTEISFDVTFITHDGATWVFRDQEEFKSVVRFGRISIGDNSFIGARSTILQDVVIGNYCIVAAGAVVTRDIPDGEVWGGVPARFICKTEDYAKKCLRENPIYDHDNLMKNRKEEILKITEKKRN